MRSFHPYPPFIPKNATRLIIGSIPPERFCIDPKLLKEKDFDFYYGSRDNHFWKLLGMATHTIYPNKEHPIDDCKQLLTTLHCGITDIVASCDRVQGSASDSNLKNIAYQPIWQYIQQNLKIKTLIYTSHFVQQQVYHYFRHTLGNTWKKEQLEDYGDRHRRLRFPDGISLEDWTLYSPSPQALKGLGENGKEKRLEQYKHLFQPILTNAQKNNLY